MTYFGPALCLLTRDRFVFPCSAASISDRRNHFFELWRPRPRPSEQLAGNLHHRSTPQRHRLFIFAPTDRLATQTMSTSGMSRVSLRDSGPLDSSANFGRDYSEASLRSRTESDGASSLGTNAGPRPAYLTAFGDDLRPNRESIVSLRELEAGWSSHPSGLNARKSQRHPAGMF